MYNSKMYTLGTNPSIIRELFEYGRTRKAELGEDAVFDFSIGNPNIPAPTIVRDTLIRLIKEKDATLLHGYTSASGDIQVREAIACHLRETYHTPIDANLIYLTAGAAAALTIGLKALVNENEEVIVFAPFFPEYKVFIENAGGVMKVVPCLAPTFEINLELFEQTITPLTKVVIINSPCNPTGVIIKEEMLQQMAYILRKKSQDYQHPIYLLSDEPYRELVYEDIRVPFVTNYYDHTLICYSFSKSLSLPGERIGYVLVSPNAYQASEIYASICGAARSLGFVCAPALFQYMIPYCLGQTSDLSIYQMNRDILYQNLIAYGYEVVKPEGAFYLFVKALESDAVAFSKRAMQYELLLVPSDTFGYRGYVRIAYCVSTKQIQASLSSFERLIKEYTASGENYE
ncbi:MAG: pyridoxal phosphate-dependent aminotransferase [Prevotella sp.]|nr:pyridoxal phosphate-dependent aminotransferase [Staphylococcus sp.]MCM1350398.1 pyridoxal phosphate-dependent aminotransferase [Prevotella sp.]